MGALTVPVLSPNLILTSTKAVSFFSDFLATGRRSNVLTLDGQNRREDKLCVVHYGMPTVLY